MTTPGPADDDEIPAYVAALGLPGLADVHVHFMPESMQRKVWAYFDGAQAHYGRPWPITYRTDEATRLEAASRLRSPVNSDPRSNRAGYRRFTCMTAFTDGYV